MRLGAVLLVVLVAGCADDGSTPNADAARRICIENGNALGSEGFNRCFEGTYAAIMGSGRSVASRPATVCNRVGNAVICN